MRLYHVFNIVMIIAYLSCIPVAFSSLPNTYTSSATSEQGDVMAIPNRHLDETPVLKCKNSDSRLELELETVGGSTIPFYCKWATKGNYECSETGALASHCPFTCKSCSKYRCADSEGKFIWKEEARTCDWLAAKSESKKERLCKSKPELATTCRATCKMCGDQKIRWEQTGQDLEGEAFDDGFGFSTSLSSDGSTVAIGAPGNDAAGYYAGHVRVYRQNVTSEEWEQIGQDIEGEYYYDYSGGRVSLSADGGIVAIAAPYNDDANATNATSSAGHVRVFEYDVSVADGTWVQMGQDIDGDCDYGYSGAGLSLSDDGQTVAIGSPGNMYYSGHTSIYEYDVASGQWKQKGQDIEGEDNYNYSGESVSISADGSRVAIGAPGNDGADGNDAKDHYYGYGYYYSGNNPQKGHVRIYEYNNFSSQWEQFGQDINGEDDYNYSGQSVSISADGNRVAVGASYNTGDTGNYSGHARIFEYDYSSAQWKQLGQDLDGEDYYDFSGTSVSISADGSRVAIGAPGNDGDDGNDGKDHYYGYGGYYVPSGDAGHVRVYEYDDSSKQWEQVGQDIDGEDDLDYSGGSVSISADGKMVAIGATERYVGNGYVRIFNQDLS